MSREIPTLSKMKISEDNIDLFYKLGNVFPDINDFSNNFFNNENLGATLNILNLFGTLSEDNNFKENFWKNFLLKKYFKHMSVRLYNYIDFYGLEKINNVKGDYYSITNLAIIDLCKDINTSLYYKWKKLYNTYKVEYDIIRPYDMDIKDGSTENINQTIDIERHNSGSSNSNGSDIVIIDDTENSIYGFNSNESVPTDKSKNSSESSSQDNNEFENSGSTSTDNKKISDTNRTIKRLGNIGNITQQELIGRERELLNQKYIDIMYNDLDKIFCSRIW